LFSTFLWRYSCCAVQSRGIFFNLGYPIASPKLQNSYEFTTSGSNSTPIIREYQIPKQDISGKIYPERNPGSNESKMRSNTSFSNKNIFNKRLYELHLTFVISGFRREVAKNCAFLDYYAASSGNFLPKFRNELSAPFSGFKVGNDRREGGVHRHSISLLAELATKGKTCRSEDMPKYSQSVFTKLLTEEFKGLYHKHAGEPGNYVKTNHQISDPTCKQPKVGSNSRGD
jgi:hypothetical protein